MTSVKLTNVRKSFGSVDVINGVDLEIAAGEFVTFVGESGSGKSTLLRLIAGLEDVTAGTIEIDGKDVTFDEPSDRGIAMVFQSYALYPHMSVAENIAFNLRLAKLPKAEVASRVNDAARILRIEDLLDRSPAQLSGGQRQRVAIGRSIVRNPKVFLFDEPLSNLDAALRVQMRLEIERLHRQLDATMIYVTHDQVEAMTLADRIVALDEGVIQQVAPPMRMYAQPKNLFVAGFIGSPKMNFLPASVIPLDDGFVEARVEGQGAGISMMVPGITSKQSVTLGLRPEDIELGEAMSGSVVFEGQLEAVERLGNITFAYVDLGMGELATVQAAGHFDGQAGGTTSLSFSPQRIHVFDDAGHCLVSPVN